MCPRRWRRLEAYMSLLSQGTPVGQALKNGDPTVMTVRQLLLILSDNMQGVDYRDRTYESEGFIFKRFVYLYFV